MPRLFNESGHESSNDRNAEAARILDDLQPFIDNIDDFKSKGFVERLIQDKEMNRLSVSPKQLFWLRDLYEKYV